MAIKWFQRRYLEARGEGDGGAPKGPTPAEINASQNRARLDRMNRIGQEVDERRSSELQDVDGDRVVGRFQGGEFDESEGARARAAQLQAEREEEERQDADEARRLQEEGGEEGETRGAQREEETSDEKVINGVRHYLTVVSGQERWLTLKQLRENASKTGNAEETLQRAEEALQRATQTALTPKEEPAEVPEERDLENIILSASMGDEEAVRKLASVLKARPTGAQPQDVSRLVAQQIATQREVDRAETAQAEFLGNDILAPIFRQRLVQFAQAKPSTKIQDAYKAVGDQMRSDFAAMMRTGGEQVQSKSDRKRGIVNPPESAGRQQPRQDEDREVPVSDQIDAIAKARGQARATRIRRS